jgi:hypothetical protein
MAESKGAAADESRSTDERQRDAVVHGQKGYSDKILDSEKAQSSTSSPPGELRREEEIAAAYGITEKGLLSKLSVFRLRPVYEEANGDHSLTSDSDRHLIPAVCVLYLLSFLDRANVANARLEGLLTDLRMTVNQYLTGLTLFFVGYIMFEVLWNVCLKRIGPKIWLPSTTLAFGIVATLQGVVQYNGGATGVAGFFVVRLMLGITEGALFPGVVFYLSMYYKRAERQYRIALFFAMASLAGAFGGILAYGIGFMRGVAGLSGWRWVSPGVQTFQARVDGTT